MFKSLEEFNTAWAKDKIDLQFIKDCVGHDRNLKEGEEMYDVKTVYYDLCTNIQYSWRNVFGGGRSTIGVIYDSQLGRVIFEGLWKGKI